MKRVALSRPRILALVWLVLALPCLLALAATLSFYVDQRNNGTLVSSGVERQYLLHVPASYDPSTAAPLVITLHGGKVWPAFQRDLSGWNPLADRHGFLVVYPEGLRHVWRVMREGPGLEEDVRFIEDLIDELSGRYAIDPERIYVNGLSNGGGMTFVLSCLLRPRIAAAGLVASGQWLPWSWCQDTEPLPLISFHGTDDAVAPYGGGESWATAPNMSFPPVQEWTARWAERNRCHAEAVDSRVAADVVRRDYQGCAAGSEVVLFTIEGGGHTWPGGLKVPEWFLGRTTESVVATEEMWAFFESRRRP